MVAASGTPASGGTPTPGPPAPAKDKQLAALTAQVAALTTQVAAQRACFVAMASPYLADLVEKKLRAIIAAEGRMPSSTERELVYLRVATDPVAVLVGDEAVVLAAIKTGIGRVKGGSTNG